MPFMIGGARLIGTDYHCYLVEYMRTIVYKIPRFEVRRSDPGAWTIFEELGFRASVVIDPFSYLRDEGLSNQFDFEDNYQIALTESCPAQDSGEALYLVIQFKEDLVPFAAFDGQCRRLSLNGVESFILVECGGPYVPNPNERKRTINAVLAAVRGEFAITVGMEPCFDTRCYRSDCGECVHPWRAEIGEAVGRVTSPIDTGEVTERAAAAAELASQIESNFKVPHRGTQASRGTDFNLCLEELLEALQLDETRDHAYWRLWYLQLYDRLEKFANQCRPRLQLGNQEDLRDEHNHRNLIAHRGIERIDGSLLRSIQEKIIGIIRGKT